MAFCIILHYVIILAKTAHGFSKKVQNFEKNWFYLKLPKRSQLMASWGQIQKIPTDYKIISENKAIFTRFYDEKWRLSVNHV